MNINLSAPDLRIHPPRSPRVTLGGYVHLPRLIDKARAHLAGAAGEYHYGCPLDARFFTFTGLTAEAFLEAVRAADSDSAVLAWVQTQAPKDPSAIELWSSSLSRRGPADAEMHGWFAERLLALAPQRDDVSTYFDLLDLDDYASFGGRG